MRIGILGAGQLAQMMAQAAPGLGLECGFLAPEADACAAPYGRHWQASFDDQEAVAELVEWADVITYESENVSLKLVESLSKQLPVYPPVAALQAARDRGEEKQLCRSLGVATADFVLINSSSELPGALAQLGCPAILKTCREGYDGKGQVWLRSAEDLPAAAQQADATACVLEAVVPFQREISAIAARSIDGAISCFSLSENIHREGILRLTINRRNDSQQQQAEQLIGRLMEQLNYVGVLTLELFDVAGELRVNEMAPRVHNTGHWTPAGARHSQFEAHLLAVAGCNLPSLDWSNDCAMINIIGALPDQTAIDAITGASLHLYGKSPRPGRKLGHINLIFSPHQSPTQRLDELRKLLILVGEGEIADRLEASWL